MVKRIALFIVLTFCGFASLQSQTFSPDPHLKALLDSGEYFQFREELLQRFTSVDYNAPDVERPGDLYFFAWENFLFNKPLQSNENIESFFHSKSFIYPDSVAAELLILKYQNHIRLFEYKTADSICSILLFRYPSVIDAAVVTAIRNSAAITAALVNIAPQTIERKEDLDIKYKRDLVNLIRIPVTMQQHTEEYIFDTGANFSCISESEAKKSGVRILEAKFDVMSSSKAAVESKLGVADELHIGNITFRNVVFIILPDKALKFAGGIYKIKGIIGLPVIEQMKHIEITKNNRLRSTANFTGKGIINMGLEGNTPFVNVNFYGRDHIYIFDTGAAASVFGNKFSDAYGDSLLTAKDGSAHVGGAGGVQKIKTRTAKNVHYKFGNTTGKLKSISIQLNGVMDVMANYYGIVGQDIFMQWEVMTIDFENMFVELK